MAKPAPRFPALTPVQLHKMRTWQAQMIASFKRALKNPGILQTTTLDISDTQEVEVEIIAHERVKLILPTDDNE